MMIVMRWLFAVTLVACGARTDLSSLPNGSNGSTSDASPTDASASDASSERPPDPPCTNVEYTTSHFTSARFSVDATGVYYMLDGSKVVRVPKLGGAGAIVHSFTDAEWLYDSFVIDGTTIFWAGGSKADVFAIPESGGTSNVLGVGGPTLGVNDDVIVVQLAPTSAQLATMPKQGGDVTPISPENAPTAPVLEAFVDAARVYWRTTEHVFALELAPHGALTTFGGWPTGIGIDDERVYWATDGDVVRFANKSDASNAGSLEGHAHGPIAVGKDAIFGVGQGGIVKVPKAGGAATLVVALPDAGGGAANQILADGNCVYYSTTKGTLARVPQ
jgi:hypothetical protein